MGAIQLYVANASLKPSALPVIASCFFSYKTLRVLNWSCNLGKTLPGERKEKHRLQTCLPHPCLYFWGGGLWGERLGVVFPSAWLLTSVCRGSIFVEKSGFVWIIV